MKVERHVEKNSHFLLIVNPHPPTSRRMTFPNFPGSPWSSFSRFNTSRQGSPRCPATPATSCSPPPGRQVQPGGWGVGQLPLLEEQEGHVDRLSGVRGHGGADSRK